MISTIILRGFSSLIASASKVAKIKKRRQGAALQGDGPLLKMRCLLSALVLAGACVCLLVLPACGNRAGDKVDSKGSEANAAAGNEASANAPSGAISTTSEATSNTSQPDTTPTRKSDNPRVSSNPEPQISTGGNDFFLFTQARGALGADAELKAANIIIDVKAGVLTLSGTVANAAQKSRAEKLVRVGGVKEVKNQLRISN